MQTQLGGPGKCMINQIPGAWLESPAAAALQYDEYPDPAASQIKIAGRMATFEVYANIGQPQGKTAVILLFSKKMSGFWPHFSAVGSRAAKVMAESENNGDL